MSDHFTKIIFEDEPGRPAGEAAGSSEDDWKFAVCERTHTHEETSRVHYHQMELRLAQLDRDIAAIEVKKSELSEDMVALKTAAQA